MKNDELIIPERGHLYTFVYSNEKKYTFKFLSQKATGTYLMYNLTTKNIVDMTPQRFSFLCKRQIVSDQNPTNNIESPKTKVVEAPKTVRTPKSNKEVQELLEFWHGKAQKLREIKDEKIKSEIFDSISKTPEAFADEMDKVLLEPDDKIINGVVFEQYAKISRFLKTS